MLTELLKLRGYSTNPLSGSTGPSAVTCAELRLGRDAQRYKDAALAFFGKRQPRARLGSSWSMHHDTHHRFHGSEQEQEEFRAALRAEIPAPSRESGPEDEVDSPGFLEDIRLEYAEYLNSSRRCADGVLTVREEPQVRRQWHVVPHCESQLLSTHSIMTPLITRWPGSVQTNAFASMLDLFPILRRRRDRCPGRHRRTVSAAAPAVTNHHSPFGVITIFHETAVKRRYEMRCRRGIRATLQ